MAICANAVILSNILGLKRICIKQGVCKVGIPVNSIYDYIKKLERIGDSFVIYNYSKDDMVAIVKNKKEAIEKFSRKYGVAKAAYKFWECKRTIYRWRNRYDGTLESLKDKSRRQHSYPNQHTEEEIKLIKIYKRTNKDTGLVVLWIKLRQAGYTRTIQGLYHAMQRLGIYKKTPSKKKECEPNEWVSGEYPGDKVQIDVKYVPKKCMSKELQERGEKFYQYTAIDEYSRLRYTWLTNAHDTYASSEFARRLVKYFPFKIKTIQTYKSQEESLFAI